MSLDIKEATHDNLQNLIILLLGNATDTVIIVIKHTLLDYKTTVTAAKSVSSMMVSPTLCLQFPLKLPTHRFGYLHTGGIHIGGILGPFRFVTNPWSKFHSQSKLARAKGVTNIGQCQFSVLRYKAAGHRNVNGPDVMFVPSLIPVGIPLSDDSINLVTYFPVRLLVFKQFLRGFEVEFVAPVFVYLISWVIGEMKQHGDGPRSNIHLDIGWVEHGV